MNNFDNQADWLALGAAVLLLALLPFATCERALADYVPPSPPPVARALGDDGIREALREAGRRLVALQAQYDAEHAAYTNINKYVEDARTNAAAKRAEARRWERKTAEIQEQVALATNLVVITADTRAHIPEAEALSDTEIAGLYLAQMTKEAEPLLAAAPTNTLEYLIGAGMRQDLASQGGNEGDGHEP
ncbi:MAG: hypothetical protein IKH04_00940 [Kiritimatiellae bacterium]|nr:hypothetical protein [Kiritimatiellia bacterium]